MWMINMKAVLDIVSQYCPDDDGSCSKAGVDLREMLDEIEGLDETEVEPVKHGEWIPSDDKNWLTCSSCGADVDVSCGAPFFYVDNDEVSHINFCPNCGARMDGDSDA